MKTSSRRTCLLVMCPIQHVSMDCPFLFVPSGFSNVYSK